MATRNNTHSKTGPLTDKAIKALAAKATSYEIVDDRTTHPGLRMRISPQGKKVWFYRYQSPTEMLQKQDKATGESFEIPKIVKLTLGTYGNKDGQMTLAAARAKWAELNTQLRKKIDPKAQQQQAAEKVVREVQQQRKRDSHTLQTLINDYTGSISRPNTQRYRKSWQKTQRTLEQKLDAYLGMPAHDFSRADVKRVLNSMRNAGKDVMANRTLAAMRAMYNWAIKSDWPSVDAAIENNPCWQIEAVKESPRERTLSEVELKKVLKHLPKSELTVDQQDVLLFAMLTGCRIGEACQMQWAEIHGDEWRLPGEKTKNGHDHAVYLSAQVQAIVRRHKGGDYVFSSTTTSSGHIRVDGVEKALRISLDTLQVAAFRPHDLRRSFATWLGENDISEEVHDRLLNHYTASIRKTYNRAKYNAPAKQAWTNWGNYIAGLQASNVVQIKRGA